MVIRTSVATSVTAAVVAAVIGGALAAGTGWSGRWQFLYYPASGATTITLTQKGAVVTGRVGWAHWNDNGFGSGTCESGRGGTLTGKAKGRTLTGRIVYPARSGHARTVVSFDATMNPGGRTFDARGEVLRGECSRSSSFIGFSGRRLP